MWNANIPVSKDGYIWKQGQIFRTWRNRYFFLEEITLTYYTSNSKRNHKGTVKAIRSMESVEANPLRLIVRGDRNILLEFSDTSQKHDWMNAINTNIKINSASGNDYSLPLSLIDNLSLVGIPASSLEPSLVIFSREVKSKIDKVENHFKVSRDEQYNDACRTLNLINYEITPEEASLMGQLLATNSNIRTISFSHSVFGAKRTDQSLGMRKPPNDLIQSFEDCIAVNFYCTAWSTESTYKFFHQLSAIDSYGANSAQSSKSISSPSHSQYNGKSSIPQHPSILEWNFNSVQCLDVCALHLSSCITQHACNSQLQQPPLCLPRVDLANCAIESMEGKEGALGLATFLAKYKYNNGLPLSRASDLLGTVVNVKCDSNGKPPFSSSVAVSRELESASDNGFLSIPLENIVDSGVEALKKKIPMMLSVSAKPANGDKQQETKNK